MFQINDYIVYGETGVCIIEDIGTPPIKGIEKDKKYYILHPVNNNGGRIYTPVDNNRVTIRRIMTYDEAMSLIDSIPSIETITIENEKYKENAYRSLFSRSNCQELMKILKTLYLKRKERMADGKRITSTDEKYYRMAEECLFDELSLSIGIPKDKLDAFITQRVQQVEQGQLKAM